MISFQAEKFGAFFAEALPILERHYQELALHQDLIPFAPDVARYQAAEAHSSLLIVTARLDGELVGYASVIIGTRMHNVGVVSALIESIWLAPECRGRRLEPDCSMPSRKLLRNGARSRRCVIRSYTIRLLRTFWTSAGSSALSLSIQSSSQAANKTVPIERMRPCPFPVLHTRPYAAVLVPPQR